MHEPDHFDKSVSTSSGPTGGLTPDAAIGNTAAPTGVDALWSTVPGPVGSSGPSPAARLAALQGLRAFFLGQDGADGLPGCFDQLADYEPVQVTLNAGVIRAVLLASEVA